MSATRCSCVWSLDLRVVVLVDPWCLAAALHLREQHEDA